MRGVLLMLALQLKKTDDMRVLNGLNMREGPLI